MTVHGGVLLREEETVFVVYESDPAAPAAIRAWVAERIRLGKNHPSDPRIYEALELADKMERRR